MNRFLLLLGSLLLLALTTALIAPRFVDWSNYTATIEEQASRLLGREVAVSGDVDLRILPMPRITFTDIEIAADADSNKPGFRADRVEALMSLAPFLSGQTHIVELTLESPVISLSALGDQTDLNASGGVDLGVVSIDEATIVDGRIERFAADGSVQTLVDGLNASLSAPSLLGPWRVDPASALIAGERVTLRANTGAYAGDRRMRLRVSVLPVNRPMELAVDGHLDWAQDNASFEGRGLARSLEALVEETDQTAATAPLTWQVEADIQAALDALDANNIELSLGQAQDQAFVLAGQASINLGERPAFNAQMSSRQVDLDRMLGGGAAAPVDLSAGWASAGDLVRWIDTMTVPGELSFDLPAIVLGGSVIRDIRFDATYRPGLPLSLTDMVATFPGETNLSFTGAVGAVGAVDGTALAVDGIMELESQAPDLFVGWSTGRRDEGGTFSQLSSLALESRIVAQPGDVNLERLRGTIDGDELEGSLQYRQIAGQGGRLDVDLEAGRFDFALLSGLGDWLTDFRALGADNSRLFDTIQADLAVSELVAGSEDLGEVRVGLQATPDTIEIEEVSIGNAAGASVRASGALERGSFPPVGALSITTDMERVGGLARLGRDVFGDHPLLVDLIRNAGLYEPASFTAEYQLNTDDGLMLDVSGTIGGTDLTLVGSMDTSADTSLPTSMDDMLMRAVDMRFNVGADDALTLIGQIGIPALPIDSTSAGELSVELIGDGAADPRVSLAFDGMDKTIRFNGSITTANSERHLIGEGSVFDGDIAQTALMAGMAVPGLFDPISTSVAFDLDIDLTEQLADISNVRGLFANVGVTGSGQVTRGPLGTDLALDLTADRLDLPQLMAGFVGPSAFDQGFSPVWPEGSIAFNPLPIDLDLNLSAPRIQLWGAGADGLSGQNAELQIDAVDGQVTIDRLQARLLGGNLDGRLALRSAQPGTIAEGRFTLDGLDTARFAWERAGQPVLNGSLSANVSFETAGGSVSALMGGLTGEGTMALSMAEISGVGLSGFSRILQASDAGLLNEDTDLADAFLDALNVGSMSIETADTPVTIAGGVASVRNLYIEGESTALRGGGTFDLSTQLLDADFSLLAIEGPGDVESMPNVGLSYAGPLAQPERQIDVSQVASFLNVRQLEREIQRVEALNAEILERERLLRLMGAFDLDREREIFEREQNQQLEAERIEAERLDQERLEAERLAAEEADRLERERLAAQEAERLEAERLAELEAERLEQERLEAERLAELEAERLEQERLEAERLAEQEAERLEQERLAAQRLAAEEAERLEQERIEAARQAQAAREQALREALLARERESQLLNPNTPSALDLSLPSVVQPANALELGEQPPAATSAPLDLTPR